MALSSNFKCIFDSTVDDDISYMLKNTDNAKIVLFPGIPNATDTRKYDEMLIKTRATNLKYNYVGNYNK